MANRKKPEPVVIIEAVRDRELKHHKAYSIKQAEQMERTLTTEGWSHKRLKG